MAQLQGEDILEWCEKKGVPPLHCLALAGDLNDAKSAEIESAVGKLFGVKEPRVIDVKEGELGTVSAVLIATKEPLERGMMPSMIPALDIGGERWNILWPKGKEERGIRASGESASNHKTSSNGKDDQSTRKDSQNSQSKTDQGQNDTILTVMKSVVDEFGRIHYEGGYRRLRSFSGILPVPAGEDNYEEWRETVHQLSEEWHCADAVKKQRLVESLRGPAREVINATRRDDPTASFRDYLAALDLEFETIENVDDMKYRLRHTYQNVGEKLTSYIYRIDRLIHRIVDRGGMTIEEVNEKRLQQLIEGALTTDPIAQRLRYTTSSRQPPSFMKLMREVKQEESLVEARDKSIKEVKVAASIIEEVTSPIENLTKMVEGLRGEVGKLTLQLNEEVKKREATRNLDRAPLIGDTRRGRNVRQQRSFRCGRLGHRAFECEQRWNDEEESSFSHNGRGRESSGNAVGRLMNPASAP
ncbi:modulator of apoptosis 1-like [Pseudophryne corroboree]|uniref:modulator of apoptosis 1-like n=1 Tax=Pseudophryne corroboree TaxID=495146 RepID=UPI003081C5F0